MEYNYREIEKKWQSFWKESDIYKVTEDKTKKPFYVLDMFPYPSGAGLHVGHPLGYIASDILSRYKRLKGFNVLHPMGFDSFGLPAEQYALETGQHPAVTTEKNIATFKDQLEKIGFCFDWSREVRTSDPGYYKWTQWIFLKLFDSWYNKKSNKAEPISKLVEAFNQHGIAALADNKNMEFTAAQWKAMNEKERQDVLMNFRLAYSSFGEVNWCEGLGTVLANDEVVNGVSERGGFPVEKKKMRQWFLRITDYADRLLQGLEKVDFSESMKEMQRNWIGKSEGAELDFRLTPSPSPGGEGENLSPGKDLNFDKSSGSSEKEETRKGTFKTSGNKYWPLLKDFSRENRKNSTVAEDLLWQEFRNNKHGVKARRQHVIEGFIVDLAFLNEKLLVEVDGEYHNDPEQKEYDRQRTECLESLGYRVIRFSNAEVKSHLKSVIDKIKHEISSSPLSVRKGVGGEAIIKVYTTRPDTIFGVDFLVLAPEHDLVQKITTDEQRSSIDEYLKYVKSRSDRERLSEVKQVTGCFTGAFAIHPFSGNKIPVWIAEYVLSGYGTGAIMAVPCGDQRDFDFATHFKIPITNIIGDAYNGKEANPTKEAVLQHSDFLDGMIMKNAIGVAVDKIESQGLGKRKINYKMRDAGFSRQRYWGEPFPIIWKDEVAIPLLEDTLPLELPFVENYKPGKEGKGPLSNLEDWMNTPQGTRETSTMPGYAGSSWYFLRYADPHNSKEFAAKENTDYWNQVDVYIGGTEHAVGHLLYSRMWTKFLYDRSLISFDEPYRKLINQGMITGKSYFYATKDGKIISHNESGEELNFVRFKYGHKAVDSNRKLTRKALELFLQDSLHEKPQFEIIWEGSGDDAFIIVKEESEKMSKSKFNVDNPDDLVAQYGADTFRMYEMFLGPIEQSKPWDTKGIEGVHRFLKKLWRLFIDEQKGLIVTDTDPDNASLKVLHKTIKKVEDDIERYSFNTAVSAFMVCVNELTDLKCHNKPVLESLLILLAPYAPHIAEELYHLVGNNTSVINATYPKWEEKYLVESEKEYPVSINGKLRTTITISLDALQEDVEKIALNNETVQKWIGDKKPKKIIFVKNKMINVVI